MSKQKYSDPQDGRLSKVLNFLTQTVRCRQYWRLSQLCIQTWLISCFQCLPFCRAKVEICHVNTIYYYEGCSNMNASRFITFVTYMLQQNDICFYKGLYAIFKLAPDLKKNTVYISSCIPLNEGHLSILTNSMLRTYTSDIEERIIL